MNKNQKIINSSVFVKSSNNFTELPKANLKEFAFIGRSNVGKSSFINCLTNNKNLCKTSSTPGKTKLINHFLINDNFYFVDLPGFGFAKVSKTDSAKFLSLIQDYFLNRKNLIMTFLLIDISIPTQEIDLNFIRFLNEYQIKFNIIFNKTDKTKNLNNLNENIKKYLNKLTELNMFIPKYFACSSKIKESYKEINNNIFELLK